jgi:hypothetical protein
MSFEKNRMQCNNAISHFLFIPEFIHLCCLHPALEVQRALDGVWEFTTIIKIATVEVIGCTIISMKNDFKTIYGYGVEKTDFTFQ